MTKSRIIFPEALNGYDTEQVDTYITKLSDAYQLAYDENTALREKYNNLLEDCKKSNMQQLIKANSDNIAKILMYADMLAQKVIADAQAEVSQVKVEVQKALNESNAEAAQAKAKAQRIIDEANAETFQVKAEAQKIMERANAEAVRAQKIVGDANAEAVRIVVRAKRNIEQAHETMEQTVSKIQDMLTFNVPDIKRIVAE